MWRCSAVSWRIVEASAPQILSKPCRLATYISSQQQQVLHKTDGLLLNRQMGYS
jgi:hypothetical protein